MAAAPALADSNVLSEELEGAAIATDAASKKKSKRKKKKAGATADDGEEVAEQAAGGSLLKLEYADQEQFDEWCNVALEKVPSTVPEGIDVYVLLPAQLVCV